ncbi:MAG: ribose 5-phosphate isomerase B [Planctomycetes bacterium]|nr:ribose 5-phosphate isomerase B [Planctomycetota bacterium]
MIVAIGSDHAGFRLKQAIIAQLTGLGHTARDFGTRDEQPCDYPDFIRPAAEAVASGACQRGIVLGGSGNGEAIVANRIRGVRCGLAWNLDSALMTRRHNDANVLAMGQRMVAQDLALEIVAAWLAEPFEGGRHVQRIRKIDA